MKKTSILLCLIYVVSSYSQNSNVNYFINMGNKYLSEYKYEKAAEYYKMAADQGNSYAQYALGIMYYKGTGKEQNNEQAFYWIKKAAEQNYAQAQNDIGVFYYKGYGTHIDNHQAAYWFDKAARQGNSHSQKILGYMYMYGLGVEKDYSLSREWSQKAADQGEEEALNNLGQLHENGWGVPVDYNKAYDLYMQAAEKGCCAAINNLGHLYYHGLGVPKNYSKAKTYYQQSAEQGFAESQNTLGYMYMNGWGDAQDYEQALYWYHKASEQGHLQAQNNIGYMYMNGWGVKQNYNQALNWYRRAAEKGDATAQNNLGHMYENGLGVPCDKRVALEWYQKASDSGNQLAKSNLRVLQSQLDGENNSGISIPVVVDKCIALLIGNSDYLNAPLKNPKNDAEDMVKKLKQQGIEEIISCYDGKYDDIQNKVNVFCEKASHYDAVLFYYSGHGIQKDGVNYIVPVNADIVDGNSIKDQCFSISDILYKINLSGVKKKIIILDACRTYKSNKSGKGVFANGLADMQQQTGIPLGTFVLYATSTGCVADDGTDKRNSPFTSAILKIMDRTNVEIKSLAVSVRDEVILQTDQKQVPSYNDNLLSNYFFNVKRNSPQE